MNGNYNDVFVFDFDGTLIHSNHVKKDNFFRVCSKYEKKKDYLTKLLSSSKNYDRYIIFEKFCNFYNINENHKNLAQEYTSLCKDTIKKCAKRKGSQELLLQLFLHQKQVFINSATPEVDLKDLVRLIFDFHFNGIFGRPNSKVQNLKKILDLTKSNPNKVIMIGDGIDDFEAANEVGCNFIGISNGSLESNGEKNLISDLTTIKENHLLI